MSGEQTSLLPPHDLAANILPPAGEPAVLAGPVARKSAAEYSALHFNSRGIRCATERRPEGWVVVEDV